MHDLLLYLLGAGSLTFAVALFLVAGREQPEAADVLTLPRETAEATDTTRRRAA